MFVQYLCKGNYIMGTLLQLHRKSFFEVTSVTVTSVTHVQVAEVALE